MKSFISQLSIVIGATLLAACASAPQPQSARFEATITRTAFGIPHITARDFAGLGFGSAYARAQDNICLMAESYASFAGERSKYFGASGDALIGIRPAKNIDSDFFHLAVTDLDALHAAFAQRSADYRELVDGWIAGYNRYLRDQQGKLPAACAGQPWVHEITLDDVLRSFNGFALLSSSAMFAVPIANAAPPASVVTSSVSLQDGVDIAEMDSALLPSLGSNGWAFGSEATRNGSGLVLGNPHFPWSGPNRFYQMHLTIPGKLDVAGAALLNLPYVGIGFNHDVAWTHTMDMVAHMSVYRLSLDPQDATAYFVDGKRERMSRREITVQNKDGEAITRTLYATRYGPVLSVANSPYAWTREAAFAVADANKGNIRAGDSWIGMARARSAQDIREALAQHMGAPFLNTLAADRKGNTLYADITAAPNISAERLAVCGRIESRLPGHLQELVVLDGSRSACAWEQSPDSPEPGLLPASQMATLYRRDYVQNSNDTYRWSNPAEPLQLGPIMGREPGIGGLRTRAGLMEISRVLQAGKFDIDLAPQVVLSNQVLAADLAMPSLLTLCQRKNAPAEACAVLAKWDRKADIDSRGAMLFSQFWAKAGAQPGIWKTPYDANDPINTPRDLLIEGKAGDALLQVLTAAAQSMKDIGVALDAPLGEVQFAQRGSERIPVSGLPTGGVLNQMQARPASGGYSVFFGSSYIQSVSFDDKGPVANSVLTYSQSADPASPHYADQTIEFSKKQLHRFPFSAAQISADAISAPLTLKQ